MCEICLDYDFLSATENKRNISIVYLRIPIYEKPTASLNILSCMYLHKNKIAKDRECGLVFPSSNHPRAHKKVADHLQKHGKERAAASIECASKKPATKVF